MVSFFLWPKYMNERADRKTIFKGKFRGSYMTQRVKVFATKPDNLSSSPGSTMVVDENWLQLAALNCYILWHMYHSAFNLSDAHTW